MDARRRNRPHDAPPARGAATRELERRVEELERELRMTEARFEGIVGIAADAIISIDEAQDIVLFNEGAEQIFGYTAAEAVGQPLDVLLPERFRASHRAHVAGFGVGTERARRMGHRREIAGLRKSGEEFPAEASISRFEVGDATVFNVVLRDISERKRAEEQQRFLARVGEELVASLDYDVTIAHAVRLALPMLGDGCVIDVVEGESIRAAAIAHASPEREALLATMRRRFPPRLEGAHPVARALRDGRTVAIPQVTRKVLAAITPDAEYFEMVEALDIRAALFVPLPTRDERLGVLSLYASAGDYGADDVRLAEEFGRRLALAIDNARLYAAAQRAIRVRDETVAVVSHDLRNPVNAIRMIAGNLLGAGAATATADDVREYLQVIREAAAQADALIQDLLDLSRIEAGRFHVGPGPADLRAVIDAAVDVLQPLAAERALELRLELPSALPEALADPPRITQVISNLVGNAIKFTPPGGRIVVAAAAAGEEIVVSVADTGPGIRAADLPRIFDRFWQATRGPRGGSGLGLPIAEGIVEAHGGRLWVDSRVGMGSTFYFTLPAVPRDDAAAAPLDGRGEGA